MAPRNSISFDEIHDGNQFEDLVAAYFAHQENAQVTSPAVGADGGRDIIVSMTFQDGIIPFERRWVIQCKFHKSSVSKKHIANAGLPMLLEEHRADGYLLICRNTVSQPLADSFVKATKEGKLGYSYVVWPGNQFLMLLNVMTPEPVIQTFFPDYYEFLKSKI